MADVFLSYSQKDRASVEKIAIGLKSLGLSVWYDARLESGDSFDEVIYTELHDAKSVLVCWSPDSMGSKWPRSEAMIAYDKHKLAAAFLRACELRPPFNLVQTSDLSDWTGEPGHAGWRAVVRGLGTLCGRPGVGALAEALAAGTQEAIAEWAKQYPDESLAAEIWESQRAHLRMEFSTAFQAARLELAAALEKRRLDAETALTRATEDFETWLDAERLGKSGARPDPIGIVERALTLASVTAPEQHVEISKLETELAAANQRAAAAFRDRDAAIARAEQAIALRDDAVRVRDRESRATATVQVERSDVASSGSSEPVKAAERAAPGEKRCRRLGCALLGTAVLPGFISDLTGSNPSSALAVLFLSATFLLLLAGATFVGLAIYAKQRRRAASRGVFARAIILGVFLMIVVPTFFSLVKKSEAGPLPYTLAWIVVMIGAYGLALGVASIFGWVRHRKPIAIKAEINATPQPAAEKALP